MRILVPAIFALLLVPAAAMAKPAVSLEPFNRGLSFTPEAPRPLPPEHPLYHRVALDPLAGVPARVGPVLNTIASGREFEDALRQSLIAANFAASDGAPKARLTVTWLNFDAPMKISFSSSATSQLRYELRRIDNGELIFSRDIVTQTRASGGNAVDRFKGTGRAALQANIASALLCLDKAAYGTAPQDCALHPTGSFRAPIMVAVPVYRR